MHLPALKALSLNHPQAKAAEVEFAIGAFQQIRCAASHPFDFCYWNVHDVVRQSGGGMVVGWQIFIWPQHYVQAVHHAVWRNQGGELVDLSKKLVSDTESFTTFAEDDSIQPSLDKPAFVPNKFYALQRSHLVDAIIAADNENVRARKQQIQVATKLGYKWRPREGIFITLPVPNKMQSANERTEAASKRLHQCYEALAKI